MCNRFVHIVYLSIDIRILYCTIFQRNAQGKRKIDIVLIGRVKNNSQGSWMFFLCEGQKGKQ